MLLIYDPIYQCVKHFLRFTSTVIISLLQYIWESKLIFSMLKVSRLNKKYPKECLMIHLCKYCRSNKWFSTDYWAVGPRLQYFFAVFIYKNYICSGSWFYCKYYILTRLRNQRITAKLDACLKWDWMKKNHYPINTFAVRHKKRCYC